MKCRNGHERTGANTYVHNGKRQCRECRAAVRAASNAGNGNAEKTHCLRGHPLSGENLYVSLSRGPERPMRQCRACRKVRRPKTQPAALDDRALARLRDAIADGEATERELAGRFGIGVEAVRLERAAMGRAA